MNPMARLKVMLTGSPKKIPAATRKTTDPMTAEEVAEGAASNPKEEMLEDSQGRPMRIKMPQLQRKKFPFRGSKV